MTAKTNVWELGLLQLIFGNIDTSGVGATNAIDIGDNSGILGSATVGTLSVGLLISTAVAFGDDMNGATWDAAGGIAGDETSYGGYARQTLLRAEGTGGWTIATDGSGVTTVSNTDLIDFGAWASGADQIVESVIITVSATEDKADVLYYGALDTKLTVTSGVTPQFQPGALVLTEGQLIS